MPVDFNAPKLGRPGVSIGEDLADQLLAKQFEIERLRGLLARFEVGLCPACGRSGDQGAPHYEKCWLAAELRG